jgi:cytochrome c oxidase assembly protein subunit 11
VKVHFDANVAADLPWTFEPVQPSIDVKIGENTLAFYKATNLSDRVTTGTAVFNVAPDAVGVHFNKVQCFCFTEQRLEPGQSVEMAVSFFVDPAFVTDEETKNLSELSLSYAFYPVVAPKKTAGQAAVGVTGKGG